MYVLVELHMYKYSIIEKTLIPSSFSKRIFLMNLLTTLLIFALGFITQSTCFCIYNNVAAGALGETTYWLRQQPYNAGKNYFSQVLQINTIAIIYKLTINYIYQSFC